jgi:hypothetical protein
MTENRRMFSALHRLFLNGRLPEAARGDDELFGTPLSARWLPFSEAYSPDTDDWEKIKQWHAILHGITRTAGIIFGSQRYRVLFDAGYDDNYRHSTSPGVIVVSTEPVKRPPPGFSFHDAVDTMVGQVIHEAAHLHERQTDETGFADDEIMSVLYHLVEDILIDTIVAMQYPGFEGYLLKYRRYFIDWKLRSQWRFQTEGRLKQLILSMRSTLPAQINRWTVRHAYLYLLYILSRHQTVVQLRRLNRAELAAQLYAILYDAKHAEHWREPDTLSESFVLGADGPPVKGDGGNNRGALNVKPLTLHALRQLNRQSLEWVEAAEPVIEKTVRRKNGRTKWVTKRWSAAYRHRTVPSKNNRALTPEGYGLLSKLENERRSPLKGDGNYEYQTTLSRIPLHAQAEERYRSAVSAVRNQIVRLRNQLAWANAKTGRDTVSLHTGDLDEEALYRAKYAADLFKKPNEASYRTVPLDMVLLIDASRSMRETMPSGNIPKYVAAQRLAALFVEALEPLESVRTWAFSFSSFERSVEIRELYSPGLHADKARIGDLYPANQTPEYEALLAVVRHVEEVSGPGVQKAYNVISDGRPDDDIIPGDIQIKKIRKLVNRLRSQGDTVIHAALTPDHTDRPIYPYRLGFPEEGYPDLIRRFSKLLKTLVFPVY